MAADNAETERQTMSRKAARENKMRAASTQRWRKKQAVRRARSASGSALPNAAALLSAAGAMRALRDAMPLMRYADE